jgi:hypothetical protein
MIRRQLEPQEIACGFVTQARVELADEQKAEITGTMVRRQRPTKSWAS